MKFDTKTTPLNNAIWDSPEATEASCFGDICDLSERLERALRGLAYEVRAIRRHNGLSEMTEQEIIEKAMEEAG